MAGQPHLNLSTAQEAKDEVEHVVRQSPREYGIERSRWRLQDIRQVVSWLKSCTISGVYRILQRLKITLKKAITYVSSPDPDETLKLRQMTIAYSAALHQPEKYVVLFQDELTYYSQPRGILKYGSVGAHSPRVYRAVADNVMTRIGAVVDGITGQVVYQQADKFGKMAMEKLYRQIREVYPERRIFVIQDNVNFHYSENVLATAEELDIYPVFLPTYASWRNPAEKLWRWLQADTLHGHEFAHDVALLHNRVGDFLDQFAHGSSKLLRYIGLLPN